METYDLEINLADGAGWDQQPFATLDVIVSRGPDTPAERVPVGVLLPFEVLRWGEEAMDTRLSEHAVQECTKTVVHRLAAAGFDPVYPLKLVREVDYFLLGGPPRFIAGHDCQVRGRLLR